MDRFTCPECKGTGWSYETIILEKPELTSTELVKIACFYCHGTGFATDESNFEEFWHHEI